MLTCYFCKYMYIMFRYCLGMHYVSMDAVTNNDYSYHNIIRVYIDLIVHGLAVNEKGEDAEDCCFLCCCPLHFRSTILLLSSWM